MWWWNRKLWRIKNFLVKYTFYFIALTSVICQITFAAVTGNGSTNSSLVVPVNMSVFYPIADVSTDSINFGEVEIETITNYELGITNNGDSDLMVTPSFIVGYSVFGFSPSELIISAGSTDTLYINLNASEVGEFADTLMLTMNDPYQPNVEIPVNVVVFEPYSGPVWHISTTGNDTTGDGSVELPFATIHRGLESAEIGDTVFVHSGIYILTEDMSIETEVTLELQPGVEVRFDAVAQIDVHGTLIAIGENNSPIKFTSHKPEPYPGDWRSINLINSNESIIKNCIIEFASFSETGYMYEGAITCDNSSLYILNNIIKNNEKWGIICHDNSNPQIVENDIRHNGWDGIKIHNNSSPHILRNKIYENGISGGDASGGICFNTGGSPIIQGNFIYNHMGTGIYAHAGTTSDKIIGNTLVQNGIGIHVGNANLNVKNTIIWMSGEPVHVDDGSTITITYSSIQNGWDGEGNIHEYPLFVDPENGDYHLWSYSPCVDGGDPDTDGDGETWETDIDDQDPDGTRLDMGAFYTDYQDTTGSIFGNIEVPSGYSGYLWYGLWFPEMSLNNDDPLIGKDSVEVIDGGEFEFAFERLPIGTGYVVQSIFDQTGSTVWGPEGCDEGFDLIGGSEPVGVVAGGNSFAEFTLLPCDEYLTDDFSLSFDGQDAFVRIENTDELNPQEITASAWIYPRSWSGNNRILQKGTEDNQIILESEEDHFEWVINDQIYSVQMELPPIEEWTHVAGTYDGVDAHLYMNGERVSSLAINQTLNVTSDPVFIGTKMETSPEFDFFDGLIHDVAIWDSPLDSIGLLRAMTDPALVDGLVGYWPLDHGFGQVAYDRSENDQQGNVNHGWWEMNIPVPPDLLANLAIELFSALEAAESGQAIGEEITLKLINSGDVSADTFFVGFYLSEDVYIDPAEDVLLIGGRERVFGISAGDTVSVNLSNAASIPEDFPEGNWYLGPYVDEAFEVEEYVEDDNWTASEITIYIPNHPPYIENPLEDLVVSEDQILEPINLLHVFNDQDIGAGDSLIFAVSSTDSLLFVPTMIDTMVEITLLPNAFGEADFIVTATDLEGFFVEDSMLITVISEDDLPVLLHPLHDIIMDEDTPSYVLADLDTIFQDIDSPLTFSVQSITNPDLLEAVLDNENILWLEVPPDSNGIADVEISAMNTRRGIVKDTLTVEVLPIPDSPRLTSFGETSAVEDAQFTYKATAHDPDGDMIVFTFQNLPQWLSATADSVSGIPLEGDLDTTFRVIAADTDFHDTLNVYINVTPINDAPMITSLQSAEAFTGRHFAYYAEGTDPEDSTLSWSFSNLPEWLDSDADSAFGIPDYDDEDSGFTLILSDGELSDTMNVFITVIIDNLPPVVNLFQLNSEVHANVTSEVFFSDPDGDEITCEFLFSTDENHWLSATVDTLGMLTDTSCGFIWHSGLDIANGYEPQVWLKTIVSDGSLDASTITEPFSVDNFVGELQLDESFFTDEVSGNIGIPYQIIDQTEDVFTLTIRFSTNQGNSWIPATITNILTDLGQGSYSDTLVWRSQDDVPNIDANIALFGELHDGWEMGLGDTITLHVDNQTLPMIIETGVESLGWNQAITIQFSQGLNPGTLQEGITLTSGQFDYDPFVFEYQSDMNIVIIIPAPGWAGGDSIALEISTGVLDVWGNPFDGNQNGDPDGDDDNLILSYSIEHLGDSNGDALIDFEDLVHFQQSWWSDVVAGNDDIGPAVGAPPYLQPTDDGNIDFEDLMVFVQMWNWSAGFNSAENVLGKTESQTTEVHEPASISLLNPNRLAGDPTDQLIIQLNIDSLAQHVGSMEFLLSYDPELMEVISYETTVAEDWISLFRENNSNSTLCFNLADLSADSRDDNHAPVQITFQRKQEGFATFSWMLDARGYEGSPLIYVSKTGVLDVHSPVPDKFALHQNYPNPFNPTTTISFSIPQNNVKSLHIGDPDKIGATSLQVYDLTGRLVETLVNEKLEPGHHSIKWDASNFSSGVYFVKMTAWNYTKTRKVVLLK